MAEQGYGAIAGSNPSWQLTNFQDRGRAHLQQGSELSSTQGFKNWSDAPPPPERSMRRMYEPNPTVPFVEPAVLGGHHTYYERRAASGNAGDFRRAVRALPNPGTLRPDRPEGKRIISDPYSAPPFHQSGRREPPDDVKFREADRASEPAMARLSRPVGISGLRESDKELSYEQAMGRKIRVDQESYRQLGRAGDLSLSYAPPRRPEEDPAFFRSLKDTPTFIRFCTSLPAKPAVSPHERRALEMRRNQDEQVQRDRNLVATLNLGEPEEEH